MDKEPTIQELQEELERTKLLRQLADARNMLPMLVFDKKPKTEEEPALSPQAQNQFEARKKAIEKIREQEPIKRTQDTPIKDSSFDYKQNTLVKDPLEIRTNTKKEPKSEDFNVPGIEEYSEEDKMLLKKLVSEVSSGDLDGPTEKQLGSYMRNDPERYKKFVNLRKLVYPQGLMSFYPKPIRTGYIVREYGPDDEIKKNLKD